MFRRTVLVLATLLAAGGCTATRCRLIDVSERPATCGRYNHNPGWFFRSTLHELGEPSAAADHRLRLVARRVARSVVYITTVPVLHNTPPESRWGNLRTTRAAGVSLRGFSTLDGPRIASDPAQEHENRFPGDHRQPLTSTRYGGTGIVLTEQGAIVTSAHVVEDAGAATVTLADGSEHPVLSVVTDPVLDLAILHIDADRLHALTPSNHRPRRGTAVIALAGPKTKGQFRRAERVRIGSIITASRSLQDRLDARGLRDYSGLIETNAILEPGYSGGPLLDTNGHLIGINVAAVPRTPRHGPRGYAIPFGKQTRAALARLLQPEPQASACASRSKRGCCNMAHGSIAP